jgi:hypothetical protein
MNRIMTAFALSGLLVAAPAFAKTTHHQGRKPVATAGEKAPAGEKAAAGEKAPAAEKAPAGTETKTEGTETAKPAKKGKKSAKKTETTGEKPAEAPAK